MKRCPKCGCTKFLVTAHVTQDWYVDENGDFLEVVTECDQVVHQPDDEDIWICTACDFDAPGKEFNVPEEKPEQAPEDAANEDKARALIHQLRKYRPILDDRKQCFRADDVSVVQALEEECGWEYEKAEAFLKKYDAENKPA